MKHSLALILLVGLLTSVADAVPPSIHYQGRLADTFGNPVNDTLPMMVRLYDAASGGTLLYEEDLGNITLVDGVYSFTFGAAGSLTASNAEVIVTTNGVNQIFNATISGSPIDGTVEITDGTYTWSQTGGSSSADFIVNYTHATKFVTVIYLSGIPGSGREITASYDFVDSSEIFDTMTASEHWLALVVDGVEANDRTRLLAVPYAMRSRESEDAQALAVQMEALLTELRAELRANNLIPPASLVFVEAVDSFYISKYEVTWGEWQVVRTYAASNGYDIGSLGAGCADDHPVHSVNWFDVIKWCNAKSEMEGLTPVYRYNGLTYKSGEPDHTTIVQDLTANGYRLPLEGEWEFAARGGNLTNGYTYSGSNDLSSVGWYRDNSAGVACDFANGLGTWPVGQKVANELRLYDMSGNLWGWCWDQSASNRRLRGGSWLSYADNCTVSYRYYSYPDDRSILHGFRFARSSGN
jgi:sulfatase modifying factor 1